MIAIIQYNAGNIQSVKNALNRLGCESVITNDLKILLKAEKIIFPGVGEATSAMEYIRKNELDKFIINTQQPFLGICLGLQLMCKYSEEGNTECLGIFDAKVRRFPPTNIVPHMGWNNFRDISGKLMNNISPNDNVYYVHSYYAELSEHTIATCEYIVPFSAAMNHKNFYATQFHPEKSGDTGELILKNFLELCV
jgi:glutamine amidotransferase